MDFPARVCRWFFLGTPSCWPGLSLSVLFIRFDDTRNIVTVLLLIMVYVTPIFYPITALSERMQKIVRLNPMTSYLDCFRWAFSDNADVTWQSWAYISVTGVLAFWMGTTIFTKFWPRTVAML
ncbi:MAG: ABC transporter permease [Actinomycetota bacterium]